MIYIKQYNSLFDSPFAESQASQIEVIGHPDWQDGAEKIEGADYELKERWKPIQVEEVTSSGTIYQPIFVAIPITPKPDDLVPGVREEDSLASDNE